MGGNLHDIGFGNSSLDTTPKTRVTKPKIDKWERVKLRNFCAAKRTINRMKTQPTEWEKHLQSTSMIRG